MAGVGQGHEDQTRALLERHRQAGHKPNRLIGEKSPYLLQHAYNPVEWYPWGDAAFERARGEDRLVFLSVGYATCHWCHVMAHESFEDEAVAAFLNDNFVSIKLDREERPDIDRIYMAVVQATSGSGGWPMTVFLTPDRRPVFGGTYFPPRGAYGRPGFLDVLRRLAEMWRERRPELERAAGSVVDSIRGYLEGAPQASDPGEVDLAAAAAGAAAGYDAQEGGFGPAPKFPRPSVVSLLLRHPDADGVEGRRHRDMALDTLDAMAAGGMYDHLGGGFHRYSVDRYWRVPHFEKMLYDQGQLMRAYVEAFQATGAERHAAVACHTADYLLRDLTTADGAFCSAEDADSAVSADDPAHTREGAFYLWEYDEVRSALDAEASADQFIYVYGLERRGNTLSDPHGELGTSNVLYRSAKRDAQAARRLPRLEEDLARCRRVLLELRARRPRPLLDDKVIAGWNGLAIGALALLGAAVGRDAYLAAAARAADFVLSAMWDGREGEAGRLRRRYRDGEARFDGSLADYAALADGLIDLYQAGGQAGGQPRHLLAAEALADALLARFGADDGGFYDTDEEATDLLFRSRELHDGAEPSGLSLAIRVLTRLGRMLGRADMAAAGLAAARLGAGAVARAPAAVPELALSVDLAVSAPAQVVLAGERGDPRLTALQRVVGRSFLPRAAVLWAESGSPLADRVPELQAMASAGEPTAYVCKGFVCDRPTTDPEQLTEQLATVS